MAPAQIDIKKVVEAVENHMTAIYELAEKIGTLSTAAPAEGSGLASKHQNASREPEILQ